ncbi:C-C motif chemokine protein [Cotia virus SPAn232]|uniref:C-C motif chemokine protein n=2 Tax=Cotia virus TaxID=39444 RepID=H6TAF1_9POXV|nr:C-C motif chemokine protein [Cotia virus SPAn232]YP_005296371.1 C-C motif chemokine protein [Cotia virus SPAn232]AIT70618.1 C-C motif chemokine protein [Cotia virus]AFB76893.1 C-C motif chemokine protein [Cotia virus SPAn232]AFB76985.1 C-C motif chemokine protein [Cotia virus SPAn232]AIT70798.1 C-C motif chemokine protein [Cotia virus]
MKLILIFILNYYMYAVYSLPGSFSSMNDCCYNHIRKLPPINRIIGYFITSSNCQQTSVIFINEKYKYICSTINKVAKLYIDELNKRYIHETIYENKINKC